MPGKANDDIDDNSLRQYLKTLPDDEREAVYIAMAEEDNPSMLPYFYGTRASDHK